MKLIVKFFEDQQLVATADLDNTLELGRQRLGEPTQYDQSAILGSGRMIIAGRDETNVSRQHLVLKRNDDGSVSVDNINQHMPVSLRYLQRASTSGNTDVGIGDNDADEQTQTLIPPGGKARFAPPVLLRIDDKAIRIEHATETIPLLSALKKPTLPPGHSLKAIDPFRTLFNADFRRRKFDEDFGSFWRFDARK